MRVRTLETGTTILLLPKKGLEGGIRLQLTKETGEGITTELLISGTIFFSEVGN